MSLLQLFEGILAALIAGTAAGQILRRTARSEPARRTVENINARIAAWWVLCAVTALALVLGAGAVCTLFALFSSLALRELLSYPSVAQAVAPTHQDSAWPLLLTITAVQYALIWSRWHGVFSTVIPIGAFLAIPTWNALSGSTEHYLERTAGQYWGLMVSTYCLSYAPALLMLDIPGYAGRNTTLLFYFLLVIQSSDILQYVWGKLLGRRPVAPRISPNKTWEGLLGGILSATALGAALYRATPFQPWQAAAICATVTLTGFAGGLTMSAIKRQRGVKDYGTLVMGHGGVLDRIDSLCFAAPVFFLIVRYGFA
jgi:phosphatidate cytidylyltransferase